MKMEGGWNDVFRGKPKYSSLFQYKFVYLKVNKNCSVKEYAAHNVYFHYDAKCMCIWMP